MADPASKDEAGLKDTPVAADAFNTGFAKRKRKGVKRKRVDGMVPNGAVFGGRLSNFCTDEPEDSTVSVTDLIAEQKSRQRKQGVDAEGTTVDPVAREAAEALAAAAAAKQTKSDSGPVISQSLAAQMEARAAKMEGLLSTGGGFRVEAKNRLDLDADNNPVMMQYVQQRLAQMKGSDEPEGSPDKALPDADGAYALPPAAAVALAQAHAAKALQESAATPLMMNIGLAEVELPDTYKARNEQETKRAMQMHLMAAATSSASTSGSVAGGSLTSNFSAQADEYNSKSRAGLHAGDGMPADDAMVHLHKGKSQGKR